MTRTSTCLALAGCCSTGPSLLGLCSTGRRDRHGRASLTIPRRTKTCVLEKQTSACAGLNRELLGWTSVRSKTGRRRMPRHSIKHPPGSAGRPALKESAETIGRDRDRCFTQAVSPVCRRVILDRTDLSNDRISASAISSSPGLRLLGAE